MEHVSKIYPQGVSPHTPHPQPSSLRSERFINQDLDLRRKRKIVKSTGLVARGWIPWHCNVIDIIGPDAYLDIAETAANSQDPEKLFSWMLKQEMEDHQ